MANHASALKAHRTSLRKREYNRQNLSRLRSRIRTLREAAGAGDAAGAKKLLPGTIALIGRSVRKGILHANAAARQKSRLTRLVHRLG